MANKIILTLVLALVIGFGITTAVAFHSAASLLDDAGAALAQRAAPTPAAEVEVEVEAVIDVAPLAAVTLVASNVR